MTEIFQYHLTHLDLDLQIQSYQAIGSRIFDVFIEGVIVADNLDIFLSAGGNNSYILTAYPFVVDGTVTIDFVAGTAGDPQINGIEVFDDGNPIPPPTMAPMALPPNAAPIAPTSNTTFQDVVINCGGACVPGIFVLYYSQCEHLLISLHRSCFLLEYKGPQYLEVSGLRNWSADSFFTDGSTYSISNVPVANTVDDPIYQSERVGTFSYSIPVPVGTYEIIIHLAELYVEYLI